MVLFTVDVKENGKYISDISAAKNFIAAESTRESNNKLDFGSTSVTDTVGGTYKGNDVAKIEAGETLVFTFNSEIDSSSSQVFSLLELQMKDLL
ncbi:hypothetical protein EP18_10850 [Lysinibacillus sphaericus]|nr:hypothetical protein [Lysinibacillus sphaericus]KEK11649.1 hypothetical protein EP18_10850 [Lysinibacillus sphaericus]